jgi:hypothetical protein
MVCNFHSFIRAKLYFILSTVSEILDIHDVSGTVLQPDRSHNIKNKTPCHHNDNQSPEQNNTIALQLLSTDKEGGRVIATAIL